MCHTQSIQYSNVLWRSISILPLSIMCKNERWNIVHMVVFTRQTHNNQFIAAGLSIVLLNLFHFSNTETFILLRNIVVNGHKNYFSKSILFFFPIYHIFLLSVKKGCKSIRTKIIVLFFHSFVYFCAMAAVFGR